MFTSGSSAAWNGTGYVHQFVLDEIADQDPDHPDGEVQTGGELGDRLGHLTAEFDDLHVFRGEHLVPAGVVGAGSGMTIAIRSRR